MAKMRSGTPPTTCFDYFHPVVALLYWAVVLVLAMCTMQPVYLVLTFVGQFAWRVCVRGFRGAAKGLLWQAPVVLVLAILNPIFVSSGTTELLRIGSHAIYLESLVYGACQGLMLVNVLTCFSNASDVLTDDKVMSILGNVWPTVALMISMTMRLVPEFVHRGNEVSATTKACTAALGASDGGAGVAVDEPSNKATSADTSSSKKQQRRSRIREAARLSTVLFGWGLEDSLETADAMRARGWGSSKRRTTYQRYRFRSMDALALAILGVLTVASAIAAWVACESFTFYPSLSGLAAWQTYAPYVLLLALPVVLELGERHAWS